MNAFFSNSSVETSKIFLAERNLTVSDVTEISKKGNISFLNVVKQLNIYN